MKIQTTIQFNRVSMTSQFIEDVYNIEKSEDTLRFYVWSENGYNTYGIIEYSELDKAIKHVKNVIKNYFIDRGMDNPKGF